MYRNGQDRTRSKLYTFYFHETISTINANKKSCHNDSLSIYHSTVIFTIPLHKTRTFLAPFTLRMNDAYVCQH